MLERIEIEIFAEYKYTLTKMANQLLKEPRSPICLFLFRSCFLNEKWLFETLEEDVNHLQIVSRQEYID